MKQIIVAIILLSFSVAALALSPDVLWTASDTKLINSTARTDILPVMQLELTDSGMLLNWTEIICATGYNVYHANAPEPIDSEAWELLVTLPPETLSYMVEPDQSMGYFYSTSIEDDLPTVPENFIFVEGGPLGSITVSDFYLDKYQLTQAGYESVMGTNPSNFGGDTNKPLESISWFKAIEYCNRRSILEGLAPCYNYSTYGTDPGDWPGGWDTSIENHTNVYCDFSSIGYRLPSEAEWEYAVRGGLQTQNYTYSGSNNLDEVGWYLLNSGSTTHVVGGMLPNELGFYDMSGNVFEWCWDIGWGNRRVFRGGSWSDDAFHCTVSYRNSNFATYSSNNVGFRLCRAHTDDVGHIIGTVFDADASPLAGVQVNVNTRPYTTVTDAQGQFTIIDVLPNDYAVTFSHHGYISQTIDIVLEAYETKVIDVTMDFMAQVAVTGTIFASDTGSGIAGTNINLVGYDDYSVSSTGNGSFTIPAVFANQSYDYIISSAGYTSTSGTIDVGAVDYGMGNITLSEIAYAPNTVEARLNADFNAASLSWNTPDTNAIEITEGFEGANFPPNGWSQIITNTGPASPLGVLPTWCSLGTVYITGSGNVTPTEGTKQAGLWWVTTHQDEWLLTPSFNCPPDAYLSFDTYATLGSPAGDHYYVKISSDGGGTWTILWDATAQAEGENHYAYPISVDLASYAGTEVKLAFHAEDPPANDGLWYEWFIDNIYIGNFVDNVRFARVEITVAKTIHRSSDAGSGNTSGRLGRAENLHKNSIVRKNLSSPVKSTNRALEGYKVWRLNTGQENNETSWISLTDEIVTTLQYEDQGWTTIPNGTYKWAVKAVYAADVMSAPAFSNSLVKEIVNGNIVGFVRKENGQGIGGVSVTAEGGYSATSNAAGAYSLSLPAGIYSVTATAAGYDTLIQVDIAVSPSQNTTLNFTMIPVSNEDEFVAVTVTALGGNYPNPFNPETTISYDLKEAGSVSLDVYNVKGQLVRSLVNQDQTSGRYRIVFNARDDRGNPLSSGLYLYRFTAGKYKKTRKMMLIE